MDATIVRMILGPATMKLMGDANWWLPRWLDPLLPTIHLKGEAGLPQLAAPPLAMPSGFVTFVFTDIAAAAVREGRPA